MQQLGAYNPMWSSNSSLSPPSLIVGFSSLLSFPSTQLTNFIKIFSFCFLVSPIPRLASMAHLIHWLPHTAKFQTLQKKGGYFNWRPGAKDVAWSTGHGADLEAEDTLIRCPGGGREQGLPFPEAQRDAESSTRPTSCIPTAPRSAVRPGSCRT